MAINIFEGARRIALLIAVLATIGTAVALLTHEPYTPVSYSVEHPRTGFVRLDNPCPADAGEHYFTAKTSTGKKVSVNLCLLAMSFGKNGDRLIPYKIDEQGLVWGAEPYSSEISAYERELEERFRLPAADEDLILKERSHRYRENLIEGTGFLVAGLAIFGAFVWAVGWIMRGFLGIPSGMDRRPE